MVFRLVIIFVLCSIFGFGKDFTSAEETFKIEIKTRNPESKIKDGEVFLQVNNDSLEYKYWWSIASVDSTENKVIGITEGVPFSIMIKASNGDSVSIQNYLIEAYSPSERINAFMDPVVGDIAGIMFWDPFAAIGIYDPTIYDDNGIVALNPNGTPRTQSIPFVVVWLVFGAIFFTIRTKFINIRGLKYSIDLVRGKYDDPKNKGEVSHFQALTTALSATVGLGNIAGVAIAIVAGGPGAVFWMIVAGFLGMTSKFVECTLGVQFRVIKNGIVSGGPMYYLSKGLKDRKLPIIGKVLAGLFAILCVGGSFGGGNMFQANQAFAQVKLNFPNYNIGGHYFGIAMAILVAIVIIGGIRKIAKVTDKIVPFMCGIYVLFAIVIIGMNFWKIDDAFVRIFEGAFNPSALKGGIIGVLVQGFKRAAFSNEAGVGSASIAHAAVKTEKPVTEGLVALLEPLIDTIVVCTLTALVLIFTDFDMGGPNGENGSQLTSLAFESVFPWFSWVLMGAILLFAFSTMISWSYYGQKAWEYLFGDSKVAEYSYKLLFLVFIVVGASVELGAVIDFSDLMILGMAFPNIIGLMILLPEVRKDLKDFIRAVKTGEIHRHD